MRSGVHPDEVAIFLLLDHEGEDNAITASEIAEALRIDDREGCPATRELIAEAIKEYNWPIGSGPNGYYMMEEGNELEETVNSIIARAESTRQRATDLVIAWNVHRRRRLDELKSYAKAEQRRASDDQESAQGVKAE